MPNIDEIIDQMKAQAQAREDAELARNKVLDKILEVVADRMGMPRFREEFDGVHWDRLPQTGILEISRGGHLVCHVSKEDGQIKVVSFLGGDQLANFSDAKDVLRRIVELLFSHQKEKPAAELEERRWAQAHRPLM